MAQTSGQKLTAYGLSGPQASELVTQIAGTGDAKRLAALGFPGPLAIEIASQITLADSPPDNAVGRLVSSGVLPNMASHIVAEIAAANA